MPKIELKLPQLSTELEALDLSDLELAPESDWQGLRLRGSARGDATGARCNEIEWHGARLSAVSWERASWRDCVFGSCDLAGARAAKITVTRVQFFDCRARGVVAPESDWCDVVWHDCNAAHAQLRASRWKRARLENCDLSVSDWNGADARGVVFQGCDLRGADFNFCRLQGADWRTCQTEGVQISANALQGLIVSPLQAAQFARLLGLDVRWDEL